MLRNLFSILILTTASEAATNGERWVYIPANFQVNAEKNRVVELIKRAGAAGYNHALIQDSKFGHLSSVSDRYRPNVLEVKSEAAKAHIKLVPALFPVGYSNDLLFNDPNLAEGLPVKNALYIVHNGTASVVSDPELMLPSTTSKSNWDFIDDTIVAAESVFESGPTKANARIHKKLKVLPFHQYHLSISIRSVDLSAGRPEIKAIGESGQSLQWTNIVVKPTQGWVRYDVTFNSLKNETVSTYFGVWGGHQGTLWWRDASMEECGPVNLLRRDGAPFMITREDGTTLIEGKDFDPVSDPKTGTTPWPGGYTAWHMPPVIQIKNASEGEKLRVSYYHTHIIYDEQVCGCVEAPAFQNLLRKQADEIVDLWESKTNFMSHDEWRLFGWDESCAKSGKTPGKIAADNVRFCTGLLRDKVPGGRIVVWNDMFDPFHNATRNYYLVNGSLEGSWNGLEPGVEIMNWNFGKRDESLKFFSKLGHPQIIAGYYDGPLTEVTAWLESAAKVDGVHGFMYTTWRQDYSQLEAVASILSKAGW